MTQNIQVLNRLTGSQRIGRIQVQRDTSQCITPVSHRKVIGPELSESDSEARGLPPPPPTLGSTDDSCFMIRNNNRQPCYI